MTDLYEVLQVDRHADPEVIRGAYRALARKYHPDFGGSAGLMASINEAWAILGDPARRAAYDAAPDAIDGQGSASPAPIVTPAEPPIAGMSGPATGRGLSGRRPPPSKADGSVLDFGRYAGWTVGGLVDHDPDYLAWLARTPIGRPLSGEIDAALARRAARATTEPAGRTPPRRRAFL